MSGFQRATKAQARARVAFSGPSGAGKTFTSLTWARAIGAKVAVIDTERGSASLYADEFEFDVLDMAPPYHPGRLMEALEQAAGYDVVLVDSLSHFWAGEGGVLEVVDHAKSSGDSFRAWSKGTPLQQRMVDALLRHPAHVLVTMRSKMEYALVRGSDGKNAVQKLGLAPVQRDGIEYEFTVMVDVDMSHVAHVTKTRCPSLADRDIPPDATVESAREFAGWLFSGAPAPAAADPRILRELRERLAGLKPEVAGVVADRWTAAGIPALRHLTTADDLARAVALVDEAVPAVPAEPDEAAS